MFALIADIYEQCAAMVMDCWNESDNDTSAVGYVHLKMF
jgi:hypothetical protein